MKVYTFAATIFAAFQSSVSANKGESFESILSALGNSTKSWESEMPERFESLEDVKVLLGAWNKDFDPYNVYDPNVNDHISQVVPEFNSTDSPPDSYDARTANPKCTVISTVRDQSSCGSCWVRPEFSRK